MKKLFMLSLAVIMVFTIVACGSGNSTSSDTSQPQGGGADQAKNTAGESNENSEILEKDDLRVASDNAQMQTDDPNMATRIIEGGTKITITVGDVVIPATLNDCRSSQELISRLPYIMTLNKYSHDYCGVMSEPLSYDEEDVHYGWLNGDIDFSRDGDYFTILYKDEDISEQFGHQINLGKVDCELPLLDELDNTIEILIDLAK